MIEKIKEQAKTYFDFEFVSSNKLTDDLNKKIVIIKKCSIQLASQRPSMLAKGRREDFGLKSQKPTRIAIEKSNQKKKKKKKKNDYMGVAFKKDSSFRRKKPASVKKNIGQKLLWLDQP